MPSMENTGYADHQNHQLSSAELAAQVREGAAIFSTSNGILCPELANRDTTCVIVRDSPEDDCFEIANKIREQFPEDSKKIFPPFYNIFEYFDHKDVHAHGMNVLMQVLDIIASENRSSVAYMLEFTKAWVAEHPDKHQEVLRGADLSVFTPEEIEEHSEEFLDEALYCMRLAEDFGLPPSKKAIERAIIMKKDGAPVKATADEAELTADQASAVASETKSLTPIPSVIVPEAKETDLRVSSRPPFVEHIRSLMSSSRRASGPDTVPEESDHTVTAIEVDAQGSSSRQQSISSELSDPSIVEVGGCSTKSPSEHAEEATGSTAPISKVEQTESKTEQTESHIEQTRSKIEKNESIRGGGDAMSDLPNPSHNEPVKAEGDFMGDLHNYDQVQYRRPRGPSLAAKNINRKQRGPVRGNAPLTRGASMPTVPQLANMRQSPHFGQITYPDHSAKFAEPLQPGFNHPVPHFMVSPPIHGGYPQSTMPMTGPVHPTAQPSNNPFVPGPMAPQNMFLQPMPMVNMVNNPGFRGSAPHFDPSFGRPSYNTPTVHPAEMAGDARDRRDSGLVPFPDFFGPIDQPQPSAGIHHQARPGNINPRKAFTDDVRALTAEDSTSEAQVNDSRSCPTSYDNVDHSGDNAQYASGASRDFPAENNSATTDKSRKYVGYGIRNYTGPESAGRPLASHPVNIPLANQGPIWHGQNMSHPVGGAFQTAQGPASLSIRAGVNVQEGRFNSSEYNNGSHIVRSHQIGRPDNGEFSRFDSTGKSRFGPRDRPKDFTKLWVLGPGLTASQVRDIFSPYGYIDVAGPIGTKLRGHGPPFYFIQFPNEQSATLAKENLCGYVLDNSKYLQVEFAFKNRDFSQNQMTGPARPSEQPTQSFYMPYPHPELLATAGHLIRLEPHQMPGNFVPGKEYKLYDPNADVTTKAQSSQQESERQQESEPGKTPKKARKGKSAKVEGFSTDDHATKAPKGKGVSKQGKIKGNVKDPEEKLASIADGQDWSKEVSEFSKAKALETSNPWTTSNQSARAENTTEKKSVPEGKGPETAPEVQNEMTGENSAEGSEHHTAGASTGSPVKKSRRAQNLKHTIIFGTMEPETIEIPDPNPATKKLESLNHEDLATTENRSNGDKETTKWDPDSQVTKQAVTSGPSSELVVAKKSFDGDKETFQSNTDTNITKTVDSKTFSKPAAAKSSSNGDEVTIESNSEPKALKQEVDCELSAKPAKPLDEGKSKASEPEDQVVKTSKDKSNITTNIKELPPINTKVSDSSKKSNNTEQSPKPASATPKELTEEGPSSAISHKEEEFPSLADAHKASTVKGKRAKVSKKKRSISEAPKAGPWKGSGASSELFGKDSEHTSPGSRPEISSDFIPGAKVTVTSKTTRGKKKSKRASSQDSSDKESVDATAVPKIDESGAEHSLENPVEGSRVVEHASIMEPTTNAMDGKLVTESIAKVLSDDNKTSKDESKVEDSKPTETLQMASENSNLESAKDAPGVKTPSPKPKVGKKSTTIVPATPLIKTLKATPSRKAQGHPPGSQLDGSSHDEIEAKPKVHEKTESPMKQNPKTPISKDSLLETSHPPMMTHKRKSPRSPVKTPPKRQVDSGKSSSDSNTDTTPEVEVSDHGSKKTDPSMEMAAQKTELSVEAVITMFPFTEDAHGTTAVEATPSEQTHGDEKPSVDLAASPAAPGEGSTASEDKSESSVDGEAPGSIQRKQKKKSKKNKKKSKSKKKPGAQSPLVADITTIDKGSPESSPTSLEVAKRPERVHSHQLRVSAASAASSSSNGGNQSKNGPKPKKTMEQRAKDAVKVLEMFDEMQANLRAEKTRPRYAAFEPTRNSRSKAPMDSMFTLGIEGGTRGLQKHSITENSWEEIDSSTVSERSISPGKSSKQGSKRLTLIPIQNEDAAREGLSSSIQRWMGKEEKSEPQPQKFHSQLIHDPKETAGKILSLGPSNAPAESSWHSSSSLKKRFPSSRKITPAQRQMDNNSDPEGDVFVTPRSQTEFSKTFRDSKSGSPESSCSYSPPSDIASADEPRKIRRISMPRLHRGRSSPSPPVSPPRPIMVSTGTQTIISTPPNTPGEFITPPSRRVTPSDGRVEELTQSTPSSSARSSLTIGAEAELATPVAKHRRSRPDTSSSAELPIFSRSPPQSEFTFTSPTKPESRSREPTPPQSEFTFASPSKSASPSQERSPPHPAFTFKTPTKPESRSREPTPPQAEFTFTSPKLMGSVSREPSPPQAEFTFTSPKKPEAGSREPSPPQSAFTFQTPTKFESRSREPTPPRAEFTFTSPKKLESLSREPSPPQAKITFTSPKPGSGSREPSPPQAAFTFTSPTKLGSLSRETSPPQPGFDFTTAKKLEGQCQQTLSPQAKTLITARKKLSPRSREPTSPDQQSPTTPIKAEPRSRESTPPKSEFTFTSPKNPSPHSRERSPPRVDTFNVSTTMPSTVSTKVAAEANVTPRPKLFSEVASASAPGSATGSSTGGSPNGRPGRSRQSSSAGRRAPKGLGIDAPNLRRMSTGDDAWSLGKWDKVWGKEN